LENQFGCIRDCCITTQGELQSVLYVTAKEICCKPHLCARGGVGSDKDEVQIKEDLNLDVRPRRILHSQVMKLRGKEIRIVKVLWDEDTHKETGEMEDLARKSLP